MSVHCFRIRADHLLKATIEYIQPDEPLKAVITNVDWVEVRLQYALPGVTSRHAPIPCEHRNAGREKDKKTQKAAMTAF